VRIIRASSLDAPDMKMSRLRAARLCFVQEAVRLAQVSSIHYASSIDTGGICEDKVQEYDRSNCHLRGAVARCIAAIRLVRCTQTCETESIVRCCETQVARIDAKTSACSRAKFSVPSATLPID
jgi:hypothetical protein